MTSNFQNVSIGHLLISSNPDDVLGIYGLGSCVAVIVYDPIAVVGGVLHALLPTQANAESTISSIPTKFVDQGVPKLLKDIFAVGAKKDQLRVYLCGGAKVITATAYNDTLNIGQRNVEAAQKILKQSGFRIRVQAVGGTVGRTVKLYMVDGRITVKTLSEEVQMLTKQLPTASHSKS